VRKNSEVLHMYPWTSWKKSTAQKNQQLHLSSLAAEKRRKEV